jgi:acetyl-CoA C-acetyltransferase
MTDAWIVDAVRTPRGKGRADGALHGIHPQALLAQCLQAMTGRVGFETGGRRRRDRRQRNSRR